MRAKGAQGTGATCWAPNLRAHPVPSCARSGATAATLKTVPAWHPFPRTGRGAVLQLVRSMGVSGSGGKTALVLTLFFAVRGGAGITAGGVPGRSGLRARGGLQQSSAERPGWGSSLRCAPWTTRVMLPQFPHL